MNDKKIKAIELRIKSLLVSKQLVVGALVVLFGGVASVLFMQNSAMKSAVFCAGVYYAIILIKDFGNINKKIEFYLNKCEED